MSDRQLAYARATLAGPPPKDGPLRFVASTERVNRYGFSLRHEGWRLDNYRANPVVLWSHMPFMPPIGRADPVLEKRELRAAVTFDTGDELGRDVDRKYRAGFLNAVSVGFHFVDEKGSPMANWWDLSNEQIHDEAFYDLAEISAASVPADPGATREQHALGLGLLSRELVELYRLRRQPEPGLTADDVRQAVRDELTRLGIALIPPAPPGPNDDPDAPAPEQPAEEAVSAIDSAAAQRVLAAFGPELITKEAISRA